ncbi:MAG: cleft lip and palate transmembrane protein 1-domain-containing protein [Olpidium bornovanus]|uniref:Cleft lip and palate transmembrane protein 1-domain-containing protein n=1 Tax=Olpidium bornovanus TaxID=278681 RepID=A0A8H8DH88_9FUNG|nr:MAG: cleft lip and palate transmembrane protein 1-domain-containing protein [Olpidium bornovanus]
MLYAVVLSDAAAAACLLHEKMKWCPSACNSFQIDIQVIPAPPGSWVPYRVKIEDKVSYVKSQTKEYDEEAFRYLSYVAYPLMAGYAVYSLLYEKHKSWYSYVLNTVVGFCYMFGFLRMTPQLFVNYKLKSVAHMPWRTMVYKVRPTVCLTPAILHSFTKLEFLHPARAFNLLQSLNTFIDDLFAFIIKVKGYFFFFPPRIYGGLRSELWRAPLLHRIACFRDDVVFLVYLYQKVGLVSQAGPAVKAAADEPLTSPPPPTPSPPAHFRCRAFSCRFPQWIYRVDPTRANEFGQVGVPDEEERATDASPEAATTTESKKEK